MKLTKLKKFAMLLRAYMEWWSTGALDCWKKLESIIHYATPLFHHSNTP
jgi:hypothetical protein